MGIILLQNVSLKSPEEFKHKMVLQALLSFKEPSNKTIMKYLDNMSYHNEELETQIIEQYAELVNQSYIQSDVYQSKQPVSFYRFKAQGLDKINILDPFFVNIQQLVFNYQHYAE